MEKNLSTDKMEEYHRRMDRRIDEYLAQLKTEREENIWRRRWHQLISYEHFEQMMIASAENIMMKRGTYAQYVVDDANGDMMIQSYYHFIGDQSKCKWNVDKGLFLYGKIGCGKTLFMKAYLNVTGAMCGLIIEYIHAKEIYDIMKSDENKKRLVTSALFIDELGRESLEINEFGNKIRPIQDLFAYRYEFGSRTFCTSNFSMDQLEGKVVDGVQKGYGKYVRTRMEEMMNIIEMPGDNRRPKY